MLLMILPTILIRVTGIAFVTLFMALDCIFALNADECASEVVFLVKGRSIDAFVSHSIDQVLSLDKQLFNKTRSYCKQVIEEAKRNT